MACQRAEEVGTPMEEFRAAGPHPVGRMFEFYFGKRDKHGRIDFRYPASVEAIYKQTDDCIFFTKFLTDDLVAHGEHQRKAFKEARFGVAPNINKPDFVTPKADGLFPPAHQYAEWVNMFVLSEPERVVSWRVRLWRQVWDRPQTWFWFAVERFRRPTVSPWASKPAE